MCYQFWGTGFTNLGYFVAHFEGHFQYLEIIPCLPSFYESARPGNKLVKFQRIPSTRLYVDKAFVYKYTQSCLILALFRPPENATNGQSQEIQNFVGRSGLTLTVRLVSTLLYK